MAIQVFEASELLMGLALFVASLTIVRFTRRRLKELPAEEKKLGRPLYAYAVGTLFMGMASLATFLSTTVAGGSYTLRLEISYYHVILALLAPVIMTMAALIVLRWTHLIVPLCVAIVLVGIVVVAPTIGDPYESRDVVGDVSAVMYIPAVLLFGYLLAGTKKATSLGLFYLVTFYPLYRVTLTPVFGGTIEITALLIGLRLLGPAIAAAAFHFRDIQISIELVGYASGFALAALNLAYLIAAPPANLYQEISLAFVVIAAAIGWSTGFYTYERWKKSKSRPTFALFLFFILGVLSYVFDVSQTTGATSDIVWVYASLNLSIVAVMFFNMSAFLALEWKALILLPAAIAMPAILYISTAYPQNPQTLPYTVVMLAVTGTVQFMMPLVLYLYLWHQMRKARLPAANRPLLIAIGAMGMLLTMMPASGISNPIAGVLLVAAYLSWWLAVTGKTEGFAKRWASRSTRQKAPLGYV